MRAGQHFAVAKSLTRISLSDSNESEAGAAGRSEEQHAAGPVVGLAFTLATHGPEAERLEVLQAADFGLLRASPVPILRPIADRKPL